MLPPEIPSSGPRPGVAAPPPSGAAAAAAGAEPGRIAFDDLLGADSAAARPFAPRVGLGSKHLHIDAPTGGSGELSVERDPTRAADASERPTGAAELPVAAEVLLTLRDPAAATPLPETGAGDPDAAPAADGTDDETPGGAAAGSGALPALPQPPAAIEPSRAAPADIPVARPRKQAVAPAAPPTGSPKPAPPALAGDPPLAAEAPISTDPSPHPADRGAALEGTAPPIAAPPEAEASKAPARGVPAGHAAVADSEAAPTAPAEPAKPEPAPVAASSPAETASRPGIAAPAPASAQAVHGAAPPVEALVALGAAGLDWRLEAAGAGPLESARTHPALPPVPPRELAQQLTLAIGRAADDRIEIRLDPPELGRVQIELRLEDGRRHAAILSERPEVHDLLRRHADLLARELEAAGHARVRLDFTAGSGERPDRGAPAPQAFRAAYDPAAAAAPPTTAAAAPRRTAAGLDIRL